MIPVLFVIQARMKSTRLPGKVLKPLGDSTVLGVLIKRVRRSAYYTPASPNLVVATSNQRENDRIADYCRQINCPVFRGDEQFVLRRFIALLHCRQPRTLVRLTADNPLTDPELLDRMLEEHLRQGYDYTYCTAVPVGLAAEIVRAASLADLRRNWPRAMRYREHVTLFLTDHPERYRLGDWLPADSLVFSQGRVTIDTPQDYVHVTRLYQKLGNRPDCSAAAIVRALKEGVSG